MKRYLSMLFATLLLLMGATPVHAEESASATTMRLEKTEGTVTLSDEKGTALPVRADSKLYSGYQLNTKLTSYAYIGLDEKKAIKLDELSTASVNKTGKKLEITVSEGQIFFNVKEKLQSDETMEIRTSNMVTGIRGTAGVVKNVSADTTEIYLLDGTVTMNFLDAATGTAKEMTVNAGEMAVITQKAATDGSAAALVQTSKLTEDRINGFAAVEIAKDVTLQNKIAEQTTLNIPTITEHAEQKLKQEQAAQKQQQKEAEKALADQNTSDDRDDDSSSGGGSVVIPTTYSVMFETDGGSTVPSQQVKEGTPAIKPENPTREGFLFEGWHTDSALTTLFDFSTGISKTITLYAKWTPTDTGEGIPNTYSVIFETDGGSAVPSQQVTEGEKAMRPENPTQEGFIFEGWYTDSAFTTLFDFNTGITETITLYAKWTPTDSGEVIPPTVYTFDFDTDGGSPVDRQTIEEGGYAERPEDPEKENFTFDDWYADSELTDVYDFGMSVTSDTTVYARWIEDVEMFTVTFEPANGEEIMPQTIPLGGKAEKPEDPTQEKFTFRHWYLMESPLTPFNFNTEITEDITLYALWVELP